MLEYVRFGRSAGRTFEELKQIQEEAGIGDDAAEVLIEPLRN